jgi:hypothetical protein
LGKRNLAGDFGFVCDGLGVVAEVKRFNTAGTAEKNLRKKEG